LAGHIQPTPSAKFVFRYSVGCEPAHHRGWGQVSAAASSGSDEALSIADRCEYRLKQADIHNFLAQLALDEENPVEARRHAEIARERAWCDGPPHCYKPALDEAERLGVVAIGCQRGIPDKFSHVC
jgi:hypothetical protein